MHYPPIHSFSTYAAEADRQLPETDLVAPRLLTLPLYPHMTTEQVDLVVEALLEAVRSPGDGPAAQASVALGIQPRD